MKYSFKNDYSEGAHPAVLEALTQNNWVQENGYGLDQFSQNAAAIILKKMKSPTSKVFFVSGGTQANLIMISSILKPFECVITAQTGHIYTNETGAIEATGHKVYPVFTEDGKINSSHIASVLDTHTNKPHQVKPKMVYISNATELGTHYTREELEKLSKYCKEKGLYIYMDGARLGNALMVKDIDYELSDLAHWVDALYIGGTKNGALFGEAIVIKTPELQENFGFHLKQKGALLAKGRALGLQFEALFENDLYFELSAQANRLAQKIKQVLSENDIPLLADTFTNQIFPILDNSVIEKLAESYEFYIWRKIDENHAAIRIITSWATEETKVDEFIKTLKKLLHL